MGWPYGRPFYFCRSMSLKEIYSKVEKAEQVFSRPVGNTKVIAVSKVQPLERIISVLDQGHRIFGENRIQEAHSKWPELKEKYGEVELHIIGPLQTNKTRLAMELSNTIHTLDRQKLAKSKHHKSSQKMLRTNVEKTWIFHVFFALSPFPHQFHIHFELNLSYVSNSS